MPNPTRTALSFLLSFPPLVAQAPPAPDQGQLAPATSPAPAPLPWPTDRVLTDVVGDTVWAATAGWKCGFAANGATFVPYLRADVPSRPATFALRRAQSGEFELPLGDAEPRLAGQRVDYERGSVSEQYLLRQDGVEQRFVFETLPNRGELVLDVGVATALTHRDDRRGHAFAAIEGGVSYGAAVAFDAAGRSIALATAWTGDALRITVPAAFVAQAELPLLVDPLLSAIIDVPGTASLPALSATDLAWHAGSGQWFATYERAFSATDHDVYLVQFNGLMQPQNLLTIDYTTEFWSRPRVACHEAGSLGCVVAETSAANSAPHQIKYRSFTTAAAPMLTAPTQLTTGVADYLYPDVGGQSDPTATGPLLIAFESLSGGFAQINLALLSTALQVTSQFYIPIGLEHAYQPSVSKSCGDVSPSSAWAIVYRAIAAGQTTGHLRAAFVTPAGLLVNPVGPSTSSVAISGTSDNFGSEWDVSSPTDGALGRVFLCTEARVDGTGRGAIHGHAFDWQGNVLASDQLLVNNSVDRGAPAVDSDGSRYAFANTNTYASGDVDVRVQTIALRNGLLFVDDTATVSLSVDIDAAPALCARHGEPATYGLAWVHTAAGTSMLQAQQYWGVAPGGFAMRATGCSALAMLPLGNPVLGDDFLVGVLNTTGIGAMLVGPPVSLTVPGCAGCTIGAVEQIVVGTQLVVHVPPNVALVGAVLSFQGFQLVAGSAPCLGQFDLANTVDVTIR